MISQKTKSSLTVIIGTTLVVLGTLVLVAIASGYNINFFNLEISSFGLVKLNSNPSGATIRLNSKQIKQKTPYQLDSAKPGELTVEYAKSGYHSWLSKYTITGGMVTFADYALLIPNSIEAKQADTSLQAGTLLPSAQNDKMFVLMENPGSIYELQKDGQYKKVVELPLNNSLKNATKLTDSASNLDGSAIITRANYPDSHPVIYWVNTGSGAIVNLDELMGSGASQSTISPKNPKDIYALSSAQIIKISTENRTTTKLSAANVVSFYLTKDYIYTVENLVSPDVGQVLFRYDLNGNNRTQISRFEGSASPSWSIKSSKLGGIDFLSALDGATGKLYIIRIEGDKIQSSLVGNNCSMPSFNQKGRFISFYEAGSLRTIDLEFVERYKTDLTDIKNIRWLTDYQMIIDKPDGLHIIDYNGYNDIRIPPETSGASILQTNFIFDTKSIYYINGGKVYYYSLQPKGSLINF